MGDAEVAWRHMHAAAGLEAPGADFGRALQELVQRDGSIVQANHAQVAQGTRCCTRWANSRSALGGRGLSWHPHAVPQPRAPGATIKGTIQHSIRCEWLPMQARYAQQTQGPSRYTKATSQRQERRHQGLTLSGKSECTARYLASGILQRADASEAERAIHDAHNSEPVTPSCVWMAWMQDASAETSAQARALNRGDSPDLFRLPPPAALLGTERLSQSSCVHAWLPRNAAVFRQQKSRSGRERHAGFQLSHLTEGKPG